MIDLSILLPAKREYNWVKLYKSIEKSFLGSFELIIVTTKVLPDELKDKDNIVVIHSERSPLQKRQIALCRAKGNYISWMADDSVLLPEVFDKALKILEGRDYKDFVVLKYLEGDEVRSNYKPSIYNTNYDFMRNDEYYYLDTHSPSSAMYIRKGIAMMSNALITRKVMWEIGGFDCIFQTDPMAYADLAIRLDKYGSKFEIYSEITQVTGHMPGTTGDHAAIHYAQTEDDEPLFKKMYSDISVKDRIKIPLDNWKVSPERWERRFGI